MNTVSVTSRAAVAVTIDIDASRAFINTCAITRKGETFVSKNSIRCSLGVLFALVASFALVSAGLVVASAQNTNSSTTQDEQTRGGMMTTQNTNSATTSSPKRRRSQRRSTRRTVAPSGDMTGNTNMSGDMSGNANMSSDTGNANMGGEMNANMSTGGSRRRGRGRRRANTGAMADTSAPAQTGMTDAADGGAQTDLTGQSYTGTATYPDGNVSGAATLAFEAGNQFTLTPEGGSAMSGRYSAVTTRGYTGVTMMFSGATPPQIVSVRLKKMGNGVSIMSVTGENRQFSFTSTGGGSQGTKRKPRRIKRRSIKPPMEQQPTP